MKLRCPHCRNAFTAEKPKGEGKTVPCPSCGKEVRPSALAAPKRPVQLEILGLPPKKPEKPTAEDKLAAKKAEKIRREKEAKAEKAKKAKEKEKAKKKAAKEKETQLKKKKEEAAKAKLKLAKKDKKKINLAAKKRATVDLTAMHRDQAAVSENSTKNDEAKTRKAEQKALRTNEEKSAGPVHETSDRSTASLQAKDTHSESKTKKGAKAAIRMDGVRRSIQEEMNEAPIPSEIKPSQASEPKATTPTKKMAMPAEANKREEKASSGSGEKKQPKNLVKANDIPVASPRPLTLTERIRMREIELLKAREEADRLQREAEKARIERHRAEQELLRLASLEQVSEVGDVLPLSASLSVTLPKGIAVPERDQILEEESDLRKTEEAFRLRSIEARRERDRIEEERRRYLMEDLPRLKAIEEKERVRKEELRRRGLLVDDIPPAWSVLRDEVRPAPVPAPVSPVIVEAETEPLLEEKTIEPTQQESIEEAPGEQIAVMVPEDAPSETAISQEDDSEAPWDLEMLDEDAPSHEAFLAEASQESIQASVQETEVVTERPLEPVEVSIPASLPFGMGTEQPYTEPELAAAEEETLAPAEEIPSESTEQEVVAGEENQAQDAAQTDELLPESQEVEAVQEEAPPELPAELEEIKEIAFSEDTHPNVDLAEMLDDVLAEIESGKKLNDLADILSQHVKGPIRSYSIEKAEEKEPEPQEEPSSSSVEVEHAEDTTVLAEYASEAEPPQPEIDAAGLIAREGTEAEALVTEPALSEPDVSTEDRELAELASLPKDEITDVGPAPKPEEYEEQPKPEVEPEPETLRSVETKKEPEDAVLSPEKTVETQRKEVAPKPTEAASAFQIVYTILDENPEAEAAEDASFVTTEEEKLETSERVDKNLVYTILSEEEPSDLVTGKEAEEPLDETTDTPTEQWTVWRSVEQAAFENENAIHEQAKAEQEEFEEPEEKRDNGPNPIGIGVLFFASMVVTSLVAWTYLWG